MDFDVASVQKNGDKATKMLNLFANNNIIKIK